MWIDKLGKLTNDLEITFEFIKKYYGNLPIKNRKNHTIRDVDTIIANRIMIRLAVLKPTIEVGKMTLLLKGGDKLLQLPK